MTRISVVIPGFNAAAFIGRAIESVLAQSIAADEIILVDDASTDNTREVMQSFAVRHGCVKLIELQLNGGPSAARNAGFVAATGDWIAILDADDAYAPKRLEMLIAFAEKSKSDFVADDLAFYDATAGRVSGKGGITPPAGPVTLHSFLAHNVVDGISMDWGLLKPVFRSATLRALGIKYNLNISHGEDFYLVVDLLLAGAVFRLWPEPLYLYTQRQGALSGKSSGQSRTTIAYRRLSELALKLAQDSRLVDNDELTSLLRRRSAGLLRLDNQHFISTTLHAGAFGALLARARKDPRIVTAAAAQIVRALQRRMAALGRRQNPGTGA